MSMLRVTLRTDFLPDQIRALLGPAVVDVEQLGQGSVSDLPVYKSTREREMDLYWALRDVMGQVDDGVELPPRWLFRARRVLAAIDPEEMV